jgi:hypothetical protein
LFSPTSQTVAGRWRPLHHLPMCSSIVRN